MLITQKTSGKKTARPEATLYAKLLADVRPVRIETDEEHARIMSIVESLVDKGDERSPAEAMLLDLLATLVENYERSRYRIAEAEPREVLREMMAAHGLKPKDLWPIFGSKGVTSEVLSGKRKISVAKAKALAARFSVPVEVFL